MPWPPAVLPINITDATAQQTTHPDQHNKVNGAMNDTVVQVQSLGNPWRQPASAVGTFTGGNLAGGGVYYPPTLSPATPLCHVGTVTGQPAILFDRAAVIVGRAEFNIAAPAGAGSVQVQLVFPLDGFAVKAEHPTAVGFTSKFCVPICQLVGIGTAMAFWVSGAGAQQVLSGGLFSFFEAGPFGANVKT